MLELKKIELFSKLKEDQLKEIHVDMHIHHYNKDSIVFYEGDKSENLQILLDGSVKLYKTSPKGLQVQMCSFTAPDIIALVATFENMPFPATCELTTDGTIGLLPLEKLDKFLDNVDFSLSLVTLMSGRMKVLSEIFHKETIFSSEAKIANLMYSDPNVFERLKNNEIASMLNITPETLSRTLTKFKKENIIEIEQHKLKVLDKETLFNIVETNNMNTLPCMK
jgi:CRP-like cAMP-binding protein